MSTLRAFVATGVALVVAACGGAPGVDETGRASVSDAASSAASTPLAVAARALGDRLFAKAQSGDSASTRWMRELTQFAPGRAAGTRAAEEAVNWAERTMIAIGLQDVHREPVVAPCWDRGEPEVAKLILQGVERPVSVLAMLGSVPTRVGGARAPLVRVTSLDELEQRKADVDGKFVLFDVRLRRGIVSAHEAYAEARDAIERSASHAARLGARGVIVRSPSLVDDDNVRAVRVDYELGVPRIPAVTVSPRVADALQVGCAVDPACEFFLELQCSAKPVLRLTNNVVGEIRGKQYPEEIVLLAARLDSVPVGHGAHANGAGVVHCLEAVRLLLASGIELARTVRVVFFTDGIEPGRGLRVYASDHSSEIDLHVVAIGSHGGGFRPSGFSCAQAELGTELHMPDIRTIVHALDPIGISRVDVGRPDPRLATLLEFGLSTVELESIDSTYFDLANSYLDRFDSVDPGALALGCVATAYVAAAFADPVIYK